MDMDENVVFEYIKTMSLYYLYGRSYLDVNNVSVKSRIRKLARQGYIKAIQTWYKIKDSIDFDEEIDKKACMLDCLSFDESYVNFLYKTKHKHKPVGEYYLYSYYGKLLFKLAMDEVGDAPYDNILGYEKALEVANDFKEYTNVNIKSLKPKKARKIMLKINPKIEPANYIPAIWEDGKERYDIDTLRLKFAYAKNLYLFGDFNEKAHSKELFDNIANHAVLKERQKPDYSNNIIYKE